jgi:hypothetical protein
MLKKVEDGKSRLEQLADYLDNIPANDFNMRFWEQCIHGHACKLFARDLGKYWGKNGNEQDKVGEYLGLSHEQTFKLFNPGFFLMRTVTAREAAKVIRHLVLTGSVEWAVRKTKFRKALELMWG